MLIGAAGMSASMAVLAGTNYALTYQGNKQAGYTQAAFLFIFNTFFAIGWLGMTWLYRKYNDNKYMLNRKND